MGVRHLETFIRKKVENGCFKVNIEHEVKDYYNKASSESQSPPPPVIVIDVFALSCELSAVDFDSLIYGARFNVGFWTVDRFLRKLKSLGVVLEFFVDGSVLDFKLNTWCERRDKEYQELIELIDAVDKKTSIEKLGAPGCSYALEHLARIHGNLTVSLEKECDQELAAFACRVNALAIISNDSDFLIYEGDWRFWSSKDLYIDTLETMEYNRKALLKHLELSFAQMPLFATLCGNDIVKLEELKRFHFRLGQYSRKIVNVANFVREQWPSPNLLEIENQVFGPRKSFQKHRFQQSLEFYKTNYVPNLNPNNDPVVDVLLKHPNSFMYQIWHKQPHPVCFGLVDLRSTELGQQLPDLVIRILTRTAGIIVYHRRKRPKHYTHPFVVKLTHQQNHTKQNLPVQFPQFIVPASLPQLFSTDPSDVAKFNDQKLLLLSWIVSDHLDWRCLKSVLRPLLPTVVTLYNLVQNHIILLFEADLLLQVAYDVATESYDPLKLEFPTKIDSRPFRLVFFYRTMYNFVIEAMDSIGMNLGGYRDDPPFDGVLFHTKYDQWANSEGDTKQIEGMRIYAKC
ncbi:uncharacterized protein LOC134216632 [Armigeres subalbatus]|uniref:uncharacterized protein LOC134216632 n=1 Tax=Armigeres subalbatus TaxID=124917 RepID=UPI002ED647E3